MNGTTIQHQHKFYYTNTKHEFEPVDPDKYGQEDLWKRTEFMYLMCNSPCNAVKKVEVLRELRPKDDSGTI